MMMSVQLQMSSIYLLILALQFLKQASLTTSQQSVCTQQHSAICSAEETPHVAEGLKFTQSVRDAYTEQRSSSAHGCCSPAVTQPESEQMQSAVSVQLFVCLRKMRS